MGPGGAHRDDPEEQDLFGLTNDDLQIAIPAQPAPQTPTSSTNGVRCVGGHKFVLANKKKRTRLQHATIPESRLTPQELNLVHLHKIAHHLALDPLQE